MIGINIEKALNNAERLKKKSSSLKVLLNSFSFLKPEPENWIRKIVLLILELIIAINIAKQVETINLTNKVINVFLIVVVPLIAIVFTGYSIFQALLSDDLLIVLLSVDDGKSGTLSNTNEYFAKLIAFQLFCVLIDLIVIVLTTIMPDEWCISTNNVTNESLAAIGITILLHLNFESVCEMRSFVYNVFQLFNLNAYERINTIGKKKN